MPVHRWKFNHPVRALERKQAVNVKATAALGQKDLDSLDSTSLCLLFQMEPAVQQRLQNIRAPTFVPQTHLLAEEQWIY